MTMQKKLKIPKMIILIILLSNISKENFQTRTEELRSELKEGVNMNFRKTTLMFDNQLTGQ